MLPPAAFLLLPLPLLFVRLLALVLALLAFTTTLIVLLSLLGFATHFSSPISNKQELEKKTNAPLFRKFMLRSHKLYEPKKNIQHLRLDDMRYHKAKPVSQVEARFIIEHSTASECEWVAIEFFGKWFDVRKLTEAELDAFVAELLQEREAAVSAGLLAPH